MDVLTRRKGERDVSMTINPNAIGVVVANWRDLEGQHQSDLDFFEQRAGELVHDEEREMAGIVRKNKVKQPIQDNLNMIKSFMPQSYGR
jgi:Ni,Fe-hydrogenase III large subunit